MTHPFTLLLFSTDPEFIRQAVVAGGVEIIVDWENQGKKARQVGADTQINHDTLADLQRVRACTTARVLCRINQYGKTTQEELEQAISAGADEIILPMVRSAGEIVAVLTQVRKRCGVGILVETLDATRELHVLADLPLARVYVGLNDLSIERKSSNIFMAVADGLLEKIRRAFHVPFGFGGLTLPEGGHPIPCRLLLGEMARLDCQFSFLRRSFHRDIKGLDVELHLPRIRAAFEEARTRSSAEIARDRNALEAAIHAAATGQAPSSTT